MRCGLYCGKSFDNPVPLEGVHVEAKVVDMVAEVNVLQFYANYESQPVEAIYVFPLDSNAAVCDFQADINGKIIQASVKEKQAARAEYNAAVSRGDGAYLLEQEKADIFQVSIGNIPASTRVNIKISYVVELNNEEDYSLFVLPTTVAPRYTPAGTYITTTSTHYTWVPVKHFIPYYRPWHSCWCDCFHWGRYITHFEERIKCIHHHTTHIPDPSNTEVIQRVNSQRKDAPYALSIFLQIETPSDIVEILSPTHDIQHTKESAKTASVMFVNDNEPMNRDLVIKFKTAAPHQARAVLEDGNIGSEKGRAAMITFVPQFVLNDIKAEFIFIVDRSGSMSGSKINQTKNALQLFLRSLPADSYFNIVGFGSSYEFLFPQSVCYSESNVARADNHISVLSANLGGTEIAAPIRAVFSNRAIPEYSRQIFVLTDGEVSNTEEVINLVAQNQKHSPFRLFTIGVGESASRALVEGMARAGRGTSQFIAGNERLEPKIMSQLKQALQPSLTNVKVDWGVEVEGSKPPTPSAPTAFATSAPKIGCLIGHRVNEQKQTTATRNDLIYQAPFIIPPIFSNKRFIVYAFINPTAIPTKIVVTADSPDGPLNLELPIERTSGNIVQRLAARSLIRDLEEGTSHLHNSTIRPDQNAVKNEIVRLGVKYSLTSKHTSFIAVEERSNWFFAPPPPPQPQPLPIHNSLFGGSRTSGSHSMVTPPMPSMAPLPMAFGFAASHSKAPPPMAFCAAPAREGYGGGGERRKGAPIMSMAVPYSSPAPMMDMMDCDSLSESMQPQMQKQAAPAPSFSSSLFGAGVAPAPPGSYSQTKPPEAGPRNNLLPLIQLQKIDGSFVPTPALFNIIRLASNEVVANLPAGLSPSEEHQKLWATAIVVAYFESVLAAFKDEWELAVQKSKKWLEQQAKAINPTLSASSLVQSATNFLKAAGIFV